MVDLQALFFRAADPVALDDPRLVVASVRGESGCGRSDSVGSLYFLSLAALDRG